MPGTAVFPRRPLLPRGRAFPRCAALFFALLSAGLTLTLTAGALETPPQPAPPPGPPGLTGPPGPTVTADPPTPPATSAPHTESLQISPDVPIVDLFLTAGPFTEAQLQGWNPAGDPAVCGAEPAGLTNPDHHRWCLSNAGRYPPTLGPLPAPTHEARFMLVSFQLTSPKPGRRYLEAHTEYGHRLTLWQGKTSIYSQDASDYQTNGTLITLGQAPDTFTLSVELDTTPTHLELGVLSATGGKSTLENDLLLSLPAGYGAAQVFADGLILAAPHPTLQKDGTAAINVWGCSPKMPFTQPFSLVLRQGAKVLQKFDGETPATVETHGQALSVHPDPTAARMPIAVDVVIDGKTITTRTIDLYSLDALHTQLADFDRQVAAVPPEKTPNTRFLREAIDALLPHPTPPPPDNAPPPPMPAAAATHLFDLFDQDQARFAAEKAGQFPFAGRTGYSEQAYVAPQDGSLQPFLVYIPADYNPAQAYPLVVYLHGYVPSYVPHDWIDLSQIPEFVAVMERQNCLFVVPFARSNTDFLQVGEQDVLAAIDQMEQHYNVDRHRVYLYGYSMGGSGVYTMATHYPQVFAAGVVLSGRTNYYLWHPLPKAKTPRFEQVMISRDNPIEQAGNLLHFPMQIHHGQQDMAVSIRHTREMQTVMDGLHLTYDVHEYPQGTHFLGVDILGRDEPVQFLLKYHRTPADDDACSIKTWSSKFGRRNRFSIQMTDDPTQPAEFAAHWDGATLVIEKWSNVAAAAVDGLSDLRKTLKLQTPQGLQLHLDWRAPNDPNAPLGQAADRLVLSPAAAPVSAKEIDDPTSLLKTPDLAGTVEDAFNGPFLFTYGTAGDAAAADLNRKRAEAWAQDWFNFAKGHAQVLPDTAITDDLAATHNLILVGSPETHAYWKKIQPQLPIPVAANKVTLAGHTVDLAADKGFMYIYPNPEHHQHYVVLQTGVRYGLSLPVNHKLDLFPDFEIYAAKTIPDQDGINIPLLAGFFTNRWTVDPKFIDTFPEAAK
ncbi:MAG: prolyl oligopeptidase family serine peptidase [Planctomycetota bacterium]